MGSSATNAVSPDFLAVFSEAAGASRRLTFARFMELALYHPRVGYYRRAVPRVGYGPGTDFFTASTSGPLFGELVAAAVATLLDGRDPRNFAFVEIGAEPGGGVLSAATHPFGSARTIAFDDALALDGPCVVFSNELFDAQPFHRYVFRGGAWREGGVALQDGRLVEVEMEEATPAPLPASAPEGYVIDAPSSAAGLLEKIAAQPWTGLFVACDYGKSWRELVEATPAGTARAYHRHRQSNDLLSRPGEQDITCHVCWDWLEKVLVAHGFSEPALEFQEAFFVRRAAEFIAAASAEEAARFSPRKQALMQLLHPAHLGQKFQVLWAARGLARAPLR